ncbi:hypothetical protein [Inquilinus sp. CA228]|uniref:hypothetical protein n=1 Tax=Inquilinus sp. CA228 TaxID=3455609 RepID=UPI003F8D05D7
MTHNESRPAWERRTAGTETNDDASERQQQDKGADPVIQAGRHCPPSNPVLAEAVRLFGTALCVALDGRIAIFQEGWVEVVIRGRSAGWMIDHASGWSGTLAEAEAEAAALANAEFEVDAAQLDRALRS